MAGDLQVSIQGNGPKQLHELGLKMKTADRKLRLEFSKAIRDATKPLKDELKSSAAETLPKRGGLAGRVAASKITNRTSTSARSAGVRITGSNKIGIKRMNAGTVRHPLFGNRSHWYTQQVEPGWWDKPLDNPELTAKVRDDIAKAINDFNGRLT